MATKLCFNIGLCMHSSVTPRPEHSGEVQLASKRQSITGLEPRVEDWWYWTFVKLLLYWYLRYQTSQCHGSWLFTKENHTSNSYSHHCNWRWADNNYSQDTTPSVYRWRSLTDRPSSLSASHNLIILTSIAELPKLSFICVSCSFIRLM